MCLVCPGHPKAFVAECTSTAEEAILPSLYPSTLAPRQIARIVMQAQSRQKERLFQ